MNALAAPLPLNAAERKIPFLVSNHDLIGTQVAAITKPAALARYWTNMQGYATTLQGYVTRNITALNGATAAPPGRTKTKARKAKTRGAAG